jgi:LysM repeat protein
MRKRWDLILAALVLASIGYADPPKLPQFLRLQGRFTDTRIPLTDNLPVRFSIWDSQDGFGNLLWEDTQNVSVQNDTFQVMLGRLKPLTPSVFSGGDRWVELQIGQDDPLKPRYKIPNQYIQAQVAAVRATPTPVAPPPPVAAPVPTATPTALTDQERKDLEQQMEKYKASDKEKPKTVKKKRPTPPPDGSREPVYQVQAGDTLKSIAQKLYGNAELWYDLYYLNRDRLGPMGHLFTGQTLVLPAQTPTGTSHQ